MRFLLVIIAVFLSGIPALAAEYPEKPVRVIVGGAAGGTLDVVMRIIAPAFEEKFGQKMVVENRPGALGVITANAVINAEPDGYTLGTITPGALDAMKASAHDPRRLQFISGLATFPLLIVAKKEGPGSIRALIEKVPSEYGYSNTIGQLAGEIFLDAAGIVPRPQPVPYNQKEPVMLLDVLGGRIAYAVVTASAARGGIEGDRLAILAVAASRRSSFLPAVPTLAEALASAGKTGLKKIREPALGLTGPRGMSSDVVGILRRGLQGILKHPDVREALRRNWAGPTEWSERDFEMYAE